MSGETAPQLATAYDPKGFSFRALPLPHVDRELYDQELAAGFAAYPERRENYSKYERAKRGESVDYLPIKIDIENVSRCNFRCTMCQVSEWPKMTRAADMRVEDFQALLEEQTGLIEVKLQGMGEPLLDAENLFEMIKLARARRIWVRSTVNGSLLHLNENYKKIIDSDICEVQVSVDGASAASYEKIRRGGKFDRLRKNCELLNGHARADGRHRTRMWVVVQKDNLSELEMFPQLAAELGFARLSLSLDLNDWGQESWRGRNDPLDVHHTFTAERGLQVAEMGRKLGVETTFWAIDEKYDLEDPEKLCPWPFERAYISSDMRVVPCCMVANPDVFELGDAKDFSGVWNGTEMAAFRKTHLNGQLHDICKTCYKTRS